MILATYFVFYVKNGVFSDYKEKIYQSSESIEVPSKQITIDEMKELFRIEMNKKFGENRWKLALFIGIVESYFYVEKSNVPTLENDLFLKGFGDYKGHCHTLDCIKKYLASEEFISNNMRILPFFETAKTMMENNQTGYVVPIKISNGQAAPY